MGLCDCWPLFALRLRTPRLVLRLPTDRELAELAERAVGRVLAVDQADLMQTGWTQLPSPLFERQFLQFHWQARAGWQVDDWSLQLVVFDREEPIGGFGVKAARFRERRCVSTGSWLLPDRRGQRLGVEARNGLLHFAFVELGAVEAWSSVQENNHASMGVNRSLGYAPCGIQQRTGLGGVAVREIRWRLARED